jgi:hypothetical protein
MKDAEILTYVKASAAVLGIRLDDDGAQRVAGHLKRTAALARDLEQAALAVTDEPAALYRLARPDGDVAHEGA